MQQETCVASDDGYAGGHVSLPRALTELHLELAASKDSPALSRLLAGMAAGTSLRSLSIRFTGNGQRVNAAGDNWGTPALAALMPNLRLAALTELRLQVFCAAVACDPAHAATMPRAASRLAKLQLHALLHSTDAAPGAQLAVALAALTRSSGLQLECIGKAWELVNQ